MQESISNRPMDMSNGYVKWICQKGASKVRIKWLCYYLVISFNAPPHSPNLIPTPLLLSPLATSVTCPRDMSRSPFSSNNRQLRSFATSKGWKERGGGGGRRVEWGGGGGGKRMEWGGW